MRNLLAATILFFMAFGSNAATIQYDVTSGVSGNVYTVLGGGYAPDPALNAVSGSFTYDDVADTLTGSITFNNTFVGQNVNTDYSADWFIDFAAGGDITATNVVCVNNDITDVCADYAAAPTDDAISILAGSLSVTLNNEVLFKQFIGGAPSASSFNAFTITTIPVPAAVWLFGSALGLLGWVRRRAS
ncbi:MAG: VPLPA-CTERM sorting domain-containing protein [Gammaproteobacteria bacterium]